MRFGDFARWRETIEAYFPERHIYVRSGGEIRTFVLSTGRQLAMAAAVGGCALWFGVSTAALAVGVMTNTPVEKAVAMERAKSERRIADREARLNSAVQQLSDTNGATEMLAQAVERRQNALATLLGETSIIDNTTQLAAAGPADRIQAASANTDMLIEAAESSAKTRAERLRTALRLAGLNPSAYETSSAALGGPLIEAGDPEALAEVLDVDVEFARRIQVTANEMSAVRSLRAVANQLPIGKPLTGNPRSSGYGVRLDPFTRAPAFHSGLDFSTPMRTPVYSTGPGVVSFVGQRSGYGNVVEIDHGKGFKTRYAHLSSATVRTGERVTVGQRIAATGSTGRSTGPHLHYEVWVNGRAQNPDRFLRAGDNVQQTD